MSFQTFVTKLASITVQKFFLAFSHLTERISTKQKTNKNHLGNCKTVCN